MSHRGTTLINHYKRHASTKCIILKNDKSTYKEKLNRRKTNIFCNNCGKIGHYYSNCDKPIISNGIIGFRKNEIGEFEFLMIARKDSLGYVDFMRGKYPMDDLMYLKNIVYEMTTKEKQNLLEKNFKENWNELWGKDSSYINLNGEYKHSENKFNELKKGVVIEGKTITLYDLINESKGDWVNPEWGFPKGRRETKESDLDCAMREFTEETGIYVNRKNIIYNLMPYEEVFIGSNFKCYKHSYFLLYIDNNVPLNNYQKSEVSDMKWFTLKDCIKNIRNYDVDKIRMIIKINTALSKLIFE